MSSAIKSVTLASPVRIGNAPAARKFEVEEGTAIESQAPFIVIKRTEGDMVHSVGIPAASVVLVEFVPAKAEQKKGKA